MRKIFAVILFVLMMAGVSFADPVDDLLSYYVSKFGVERGEIIVDALPDETGRFTDIYMSLKGLVIEDLRIDNVTVRMKGVQFNEPSNWKDGNVECKEAISIQGVANIFEDDINNAIKAKTFGDGRDEWHDLSMKIEPSGLSGRGYYKFGFLDILIEITSNLRIVKGKELWLKDPQVKINKMDLPDYVTKQALSKIQPLVNLNEFPLPLSLHKIELKKGNAVISTRSLPQPFSEGLRYSYTKN
ncbi:MAG: DUF2993 domain-containing protein [Synergistaceae bacterium]|nr:DUF2993 domain-containing protein [Synergistaceae bacterium]